MLRRRTEEWQLLGGAAGEDEVSGQKLKRPLYCRLRALLKFSM